MNDPSSPQLLSEKPKPPARERERHRPSFFWIKRTLFLLPVGLLLWLPACKTPDFYYKEYGLYNYTDEGFLLPDLLQTRGEYPLPEGRYGIKAARQICLQEALENARNKTIRVLIHTRLRLPARKGDAGISLNDFDRDYPFPLTPADQIRGRIDFDTLLEKGYIALQDLRSSKKCTVVFRIREPDLIKKIRATPLTFKPENLKYDPDHFWSRPRYYREKNDQEVDSERKGFDE